jgi:hypothetical protein
VFSVHQLSELVCISLDQPSDPVTCSYPSVALLVTFLVLIPFCGFVYVYVIRMEEIVSFTLGIRSIGCRELEKGVDGGNGVLSSHCSLVIWIALVSSYRISPDLQTRSMTQGRAGQADPD